MVNGGGIDPFNASNGSDWTLDEAEPDSKTGRKTSGVKINTYVLQNGIQYLNQTLKFILAHYFCL